MCGALTTPLPVDGHAKAGLSTNTTKICSHQKFVAIRYSKIAYNIEHTLSFLRTWKKNMNSPCNKEQHKVYFELYNRPNKFHEQFLYLETKPNQLLPSQ